MSVSRMFEKIGLNWISYYSDKHLDYKITPVVGYSNMQRKWNDANNSDKFFMKVSRSAIFCVHAVNQLLSRLWLICYLSWWYFSWFSAIRTFWMNLLLLILYLPLYWLCEISLILGLVYKPHFGRVKFNSVVVRQKCGIYVASNCVCVISRV